MNYNPKSYFSYVVPISLIIYLLYASIYYNLYTIYYIEHSRYTYIISDVIWTDLGIPRYAFAYLRFNIIW